MNPAPGAFRRCHDRWGRFERAAASLAPEALCLVDRRVAKLHPHIPRVLRARQATVVQLDAAEHTKSMQRLVRIAADAPASCSGVVVVGGGTLGDVGTVLAHLVRRGVPLTHVPTTLLAAVDSSVGGKGAVHARSGGRWVKNAWGVFHYPAEAWLCPELWESLSEAQQRQGAVEAFKMDLCLERDALSRWAHGTPAELVKRARELKERVCAKDPYDSCGVRRVLNFGHTFGHAFESLSNFKIAHGDAVALGLMCALDVGRMIGVTPGPVAEDAEWILQGVLGAPGRRDLRKLLQRHTPDDLAALVAADKKGASLDGANFVLLEREGRARVHWVERTTWERLMPAWRGTHEG
jgi:3-dehydroquinate synthase